MRRLKLALYDLTLQGRRSKKLRRDFSSYGLIEVPRFLDAEWAAELRRVVNGIYSELAVAKEAGSEAFVADEELAYHFTAWNGVNLKQLPMYLDAANPDLARSWGRLFDHIKGQTEIIFGSTWEFVPLRSWFRRHIGFARKVPWHIDADAAAISGFGQDAFNVWLPLEAVGDDLPSLDVVPSSHQVMRQLPLLTGPDKYRDDDFVSNLGKAVTPALRPGDALIFDQYTLHRTQPVGSEGSLRTACEFRFVR